MSAAEMIGLAVTATLFGGVAGAWAASAIIVQRDGSSAADKLRAEAHARWLAARLTASRTTVSFVTAVRTLAAEPRDSDLFPLRVVEANQSRNRWCDALRELEAAEAALAVAHGDESLRERLPGYSSHGCFPGCGSVDVVGIAVSGDGLQVKQLIRQLRTFDRRAMEMARAAMSTNRKSTRRWREVASRLASFFESIGDKWSAR